jgi:hypothetical protein
MNLLFARMKVDSPESGIFACYSEAVERKTIIVEVEVDDEEV